MKVIKKLLMVLLMLALVMPSLAKEKIEVITTLFPLYDFARQVGGKYVKVKLLLPPGVEAHSFSPTPRDILRIQHADIFIYTGALMEPWVDELLKGIQQDRLMVIKASQGLDLKAVKNSAHGHHEGHQHSLDPHYWLDPILAIDVVETITQGLVERDSQHRQYYLENQEKLKQKLKALDKTIRDVLAKCQRQQVIFAGHNMFSYFANRYHLTFINAYPNFSPNARPTPKALMTLIKQMRHYDIKTVYHEELILPKVGEVIVRETGATLYLLHSLSNLSKKDYHQNPDYIKLMQENIEKLKIGLAYADNTPSQ